MDAAAETLQDHDPAPTPALAAFTGSQAVEIQPRALTFVDPDRRPPRAAVVDLEGSPAVRRTTQCDAVAASTGERCSNERMADATLCASHLEASEVTRWHEH